MDTDSAPAASSGADKASTMVCPRCGERCEAVDFLCVACGWRLDDPAFESDESMDFTESVAFARRLRGMGVVSYAMGLALLFAGAYVGNRGVSPLPWGVLGGVSLLTGFLCRAYSERECRCPRCGVDIDASHLFDSAEDDDALVCYHCHARLR